MNAYPDLVLNFSNRLSKATGDAVINKGSQLAHKLLNTPVWNKATPKGATTLDKLDHQKNLKNEDNKPVVVYWVTCTTRIFGVSKHTNQNDTKIAAVNLLKKSGFNIIIPPNIVSTCCGQPHGVKRGSIL